MAVLPDGGLARSVPSRFAGSPMGPYRYRGMAPVGSASRSWRRHECVCSPRRTQAPARLSRSRPMTKPPLASNASSVITKYQLQLPRSLYTCPIGIHMRDSVHCSDSEKVVSRNSLPGHPRDSWDFCRLRLALRPTTLCTLRSPRFPLPAAAHSAHRPTSQHTGRRVTETELPNLCEIARRPEVKLVR